MPNQALRPSERSVDLAVEAEDAARPGIGDQPDLARLARLEAHRCSRRDIEPAATRFVALEGKGAVGFVEMVMRADLDRPVAGIGDVQRHCRAAGIELDLAGGNDDLTWDHRRYRIGWWTVTSLVPSGKVASTWISWTISGTPSITCSRVSTVAPSRINSATVRPSRAPSTT